MSRFYRTTCLSVVTSPYAQIRDFLRLKLFYSSCCNDFYFSNILKKWLLCNIGLKNNGHKQNAIIPLVNSITKDFSASNLENWVLEQLDRVLEQLAMEKKVFSFQYRSPGECNSCVITNSTFLYIFDLQNQDFLVTTSEVGTWKTGLVEKNRFTSASEPWGRKFICDLFPQMNDLQNQGLLSHYFKSGLYLNNWPCMQK